MILALNNAECHVNYSDDPMNNAEKMIRGFGYSFADDLQKIIASDS